MNHVPAHLLEQPVFILAGAVIDLGTEVGITGPEREPAVDPEAQARQQRVLRDTTEAVGIAGVGVKPVAPGSFLFTPVQHSGCVERRPGANRVIGGGKLAGIKTQAGDKKQCCCTANGGHHFF